MPILSVLRRIEIHQKTSVSFPSYNDEIVLSLHNFLQYRAKILSKGISSSRYGSSILSGQLPPYILTI